MGNSYQVNIVLSDEDMAKFNKVVSEQIKAQVTYIPKTDSVLMGDQEWLVSFN